MAWRDNIETAWPTLGTRYDERFRRMWRYYLAISIAMFRTRRSQLWQIVLTAQAWLADTSPPALTPIRAPFGIGQPTISPGRSLCSREQRKPGRICSGRALQCDSQGCHAALLERDLLGLHDVALAGTQFRHQVSDGRARIRRNALVVQCPVECLQQLVFGFFQLRHVGMVLVAQVRADIGIEAAGSLRSTSPICVGFPPVGAGSRSKALRRCRP